MQSNSKFHTDLDKLKRKAAMLMVKLRLLLILMGKTMVPMLRFKLSVEQKLNMVCKIIKLSDKANL